MDMIGSIESLDLSKIIYQTINNASLFYSTSPKLTYLFTISMFFMIYYYKEIVKSSTLICANKRFKDFLIEHCGEIIEKPIYPTFWAFGGHAQTILANFIRGTLPRLQYDREVITMPDGGEVSIDWYQDKELKESTDSIHKPIVVFMPGLTGDSQTEYIISLVPIIQSIGVKCCVFNNRGRGGMKLKTCRLYCAANCEDAEFVLKHIKSSYPNSKLIAVGISLGGIVLGRYLTQSGEQAVVDAAMLISVCFDFFAGGDSLEGNGLNLALNRHLSRTLKQILIEQRDVLEQSDKRFDFDAIFKSETLKQFDSLFTCPMWNFDTVDDYYREASLKDRLHLIKKPTLCLNAADDMFQPLEALPIEQFKNSSHIALLITQRGGHIGFMDGHLPCAPFFSERLCKQYLSALIKLDDIKESLS